MERPLQGRGGVSIVRRARTGRPWPACVFAVALIVCLTLTAGATADTTLGSNLEDGYEAAFGGTTGITVYQEAAPSEVISAPAGGTITSWSVRSGDLNAKYELRVLHPVGNEFTAAGTSAPQTVPDSEDKVRGPYSVSLSVTAGDRIALYVVKGLGAPINNTLSPLADELNYLQDPFSDGSTKAPALTPPLGGTQELPASSKLRAGTSGQQGPTGHLGRSPRRGAADGERRNLGRRNLVRLSVASLHGRHLPADHRRDGTDVRAGIGG